MLPAVARFTRVCAYDRPGTYLLPNARSRSDPVAMPRSARDIALDLRALLVRQLSNPVRWADTVRALAARGLNQLIECGPGKVLTALNRRIERRADFECLALEDENSLAAALAAVGARAQSHGNGCDARERRCTGDRRLAAHRPERIGRAALVTKRDLPLGPLSDRLEKVHGGRQLVTEAEGGLSLAYTQAARRVRRWAAGIAVVAISHLVTFLRNTSAYRRALRERWPGGPERYLGGIHPGAGMCERMLQPAALEKMPPAMQLRVPPLELLHALVLVLGQLPGHAQQLLGRLLDQRLPDRRRAGEGELAQPRVLDPALRPVDEQPVDVVIGRDAGDGVGGRAAAHPPGEDEVLPLGLRRLGAGHHLPPARG